MLDWLRQPWFHAVQGNHEDYAIHHVRSGKVDQMNWRGYGGGWFLDLPEERQREYAQASRPCPWRSRSKRAMGRWGWCTRTARCCSGRAWKRLRDRYKRTSAVCQWSRDRLRLVDRAGVLGVRAVVAGHTPVAEPLLLGNVYHIDTEGWKDGYFTFLDLESLQAWPRAMVTEPESADDEAGQDPA